MKSSAKQLSRIDPYEFDALPMNFEHADDYGWTLIARAVVDYDSNFFKFDQNNGLQFTISFRLLQHQSGQITYR